MENEKKENKLKKFVLDNRAAICMGVGIAIGTVLGGTVIMKKYADAIKLDELTKKSVPWEEGAPEFIKVILDWWKKADVLVDQAADDKTPIAMLPKETERIVEYAKKQNDGNFELVGTLVFAKKADS